MNNQSFLSELKKTVLNDSALGGQLDQLDTATLRHRLLALAELKLLEAITNGCIEKELMVNLLRIIKPLATLEIRERDLSEKRRLAHERAEAKASEKRSQGLNKTKTTDESADHAAADSPEPRATSIRHRTTQEPPCKSGQLSQPAALPPGAGGVCSNTDDTRLNSDGSRLSEPPFER